MGVSEKTVAEKILELTKKANCQISFYPIIAFGRWSAYPHHKAGRRRLRRGDLVLVDLGAKYRGYCSDLTRTFTFGPPTRKQKKLINRVLNAQRFALNRIRPGISYRAADRLVRHYFLDHGIKPKALRHGLGHGIGRLVHEGFTLSVKSAKDGKLTIGDVFTIEPGVYYRGWGGVRIEDTVTLTENGIKPLTAFPRTFPLTVVSSKKKRASHSHR